MTLLFQCAGLMSNCDKELKLISFFCGCGGLDLGFRKAGYQITWANDNAHSVQPTYEYNFPTTYFCNRSINDLKLDEIPSDAIGIIGGPPCQSWSNAGKGGGFNDPRGRVFLTFIKILKEKKPLFFVAENVKGLWAARNRESFLIIKESFETAGYDLWIDCLNANDYEVAQNRERIFFVGFRKDLDVKYEFPKPMAIKPVVRDAIFDLQQSAVPMGQIPSINAHEYWVGSYSYIFMSRNRVLDWNRPSYTVQASGRQTSIHPSSPKMIIVEKDRFIFQNDESSPCRRLSARECARLQSFPDDFIFKYHKLNDVYKMIGNAVPVNLAFHLGLSIKKFLEKL